MKKKVITMDSVSVGLAVASVMIWYILHVHYVFTI